MGSSSTEWDNYRDAIKKRFETNGDPFPNIGKQRSPPRNWRGKLEARGKKGVKGKTIQGPWREKSRKGKTEDNRRLSIRSQRDPSFLMKGGNNQPPKKSANCRWKKLRREEKNQGGERTKGKPRCPIENCKKLFRKTFEVTNQNRKPKKKHIIPRGSPSKLAEELGKIPDIGLGLRVPLSLKKVGESKLKELEQKGMAIS